MALTEAEEKALKDGHATMTAFIESVKPTLAEVPTLKAALAVKDGQIADLTSKVTPLSVNSATAALKTAYPDVPEASLLAVLSLPAETQKALLAPIQKQATEFKTALVKTDATSAWADAGSIEPSTDAERLAATAEKQKAYSEHKKSGNLFGMLDERASEIAAHVRRGFAR